MNKQTKLVTKDDLLPFDEYSINRKQLRKSLVEFKNEQFSISPGQAAVFYSGPLLLGGGIIQPR